MNPFKPKNWSLTQRLSIFFALATAVILLTLSAILYAGLINQLKKKNEQELESILNVQQGVIQTIHGQRRPTVWQQHWFENFDPEARLLLRITAPDGSLYAESNNLTVPPQAFPAPTEDFSYVVHIQPLANGGTAKMYLTAKEVRVKGDQKWLIQTALNVSQEKAILDSYRNYLKAVILLAIIASTLIGAFIARRGIKPLAILNGEIGKINAEKLSFRIGDNPWPRELKELADSFDNMLARLENSFNELTRFSSDIAHEFRSPINNMIAAATVIQSQERTPEEYKNTLLMIVDEAQRLSRMISTMLFLARADNATQTIKRETITTEALFGRLFDFFSILAEEKQITLSVSGRYTLFADGQLISRALSNLLDNAVRHTAPGGKISLSAEADGDSILISVTDSGEGIAAADLPHVFERFYRADNARADNESTGLGLAIVKSIVELHGGSIRAISEPGKGSRFTITLPKPNRES